MDRTYTRQITRTHYIHAYHTLKLRAREREQERGREKARTKAKIHINLFMHMRESACVCNRIYCYLGEREKVESTKTNSHSSNTDGIETHSV